MTGAGSFVRAILEILCGQWLARLAKSWLRKDWQPPTKSMASGIWGTLVFYWCVLSRFMENSSSWHRVSPTAQVWVLLGMLVFLSRLVRALWLPETSDGKALCTSGLAAFVLGFCWELPQTLTLAMPSQFVLTALPSIFWSGHGLPWDAGRVLHRAHCRACGQKEVKASTLLAELLKTGPDKGQKSYKSQKVNKRVVNFLADT